MKEKIQTKAEKELHAGLEEVNLHFERGWDHVASTWGQCLVAESRYLAIANKEERSSTYACKEMKSAKNMIELERGLHAPDEKAAWLISWLQFSERSRELSSCVQTSDVQKLWDNK